MQARKLVAVVTLASLFSAACTDLSGPDVESRSGGSGQLMSEDSQDLGTLGGSSSRANGVNADSQVVGRSQGPDVPGVGSHAFRWTPATGMIDLTPGASSSSAAAVNDAGQVVGDIVVANGAPLRAARWGPLGTMELLGNLPGGDEGQAFGISSTGVAVGAATRPKNGDIATHAVLWDVVGLAQDLGTLGGDHSEAIDLNDSLQVVGSSSDAAGNFRAFLWSAATGMQPLPTPYGGISYANAINNAGTIVGGMTTASGHVRAVMWRSGGQVVDLGTLGGLSSTANDIDQHGRVVGQSDDGSGRSRSFIWTEDDGMRDIGDPDGSASSISTTGLVAGSSDARYPRAMLWSVGALASEIEIELSRDEFAPVVARCFDAVAQTAETYVGTYKCSTAPAKVPVPRSDTTTGTISVRFGSDPAANVVVTVRVEPVDDSGSHLHDSGNRPSGRFLLPEGPTTEVRVETDTSGIASFSYRTSGVSGEEDLIAEIVSTDTIADTVRISIGLPLQRMPRSGDLEADSSGVASYTFVVDNVGNHGPRTDNGVTARGEEVILDILNRYVENFGAAGFQDDSLATTPNNGIGFAITEASLPRGGLFDVGPEMSTPQAAWRQPHQFHRTGMDFDIRFWNIPVSFRQRFRTVCRDFGALCVEEPDHIHVFVDYDQRRQNQFLGG